MAWLDASMMVGFPILCGQNIRDHFKRALAAGRGEGPVGGKIIWGGGLGWWTRWFSPEQLCMK